MTDADWLKAIVGAMVIIMIAPWATWVSRAAGGALSREEHRKLCEERESRMASDLAEIKKMIADNNKDAIDSRHRLGDQLSKLTARVAVFTGTYEDDQGRAHERPRR